MVGATIAAATYDALLGMRIILIAYIVKIHREENVLVTAFGDEYVQFKHETPAIIPMPWRRRASEAAPEESTV